MKKSLDKANLSEASKKQALERHKSLIELGSSKTPLLSLLCTEAIAAGVEQIIVVTSADGVARRSAKVRLIRDSVVIHEGTLSTLRRFKDEVKEAFAGQECGMAFENYQDIHEGDVIELFEVETIARTLEA